jgi:methyl-accepting chemotaxis protein
MDSSQHTAVGPIRIPRPFRARLVVAVTAVVVLSLLAAGVLIYLVADQVIGQSYYSAHRDLQRIDRNLLPSLALIVGGLSLVSGLLVLLILSLAFRRIERADAHLNGLLSRIGDGDLVRRDEAGARFLGPATQVADESRERLRRHLEAIKPVVDDLSRAAMKLNYHAFEREDLTIQQVRDSATELTAHVRRVSDSVKWFNT